MPLQKALPVAFHSLILMKTLQGRFRYNPHLTEEEMEAQGD